MEMTRYHRTIIHSISYLLIIFVSLAFASTRSAIAESVIGPHSSVFEIRAARGAGRAPELRLDVAQTTWLLDKKGAKLKEIESLNYRIGIGPEYFRIPFKNRMNIYDFALERVFVLDPSKGTFANHSLMAQIGFRLKEAANRQSLVRMGAAMGSDALKKIPPRTIEPFWRTTEMGVALGDDAKHKPTIHVEPDGSLVAKYKDRTIARFLFLGNSLTDRQQRMFSRFIRYKLNLHPAIVDRFEKLGRMPSEIVYNYYKGFDKTETRVVFASAGLQEVDYPLSSVAKIDPTQGFDDAFMLETLPIMLSAAAGKHGSGPPKTSVYLDRIEKALSEGNTIDAYLTVMELALFDFDAINCKNKSTTDRNCALFREAIIRAQKDSRTIEIHQANNPNRTFEDLLASAEILTGQSRKNLSFGEILDLWAANKYSAARMRTTEVKMIRELDRKALKAYRTVLIANPYLGCVYKDIGQFYHERFDTARAWLFWDLGRALPNKTVCGLFRDIDRVEKKIREDFPGFF